MEEKTMVGRTGIGFGRGAAEGIAGRMEEGDGGKALGRGALTKRGTGLDGRKRGRGGEECTMSCCSVGAR